MITTCALIGCANENTRPVEHPERGELRLCPYHAKWVRAINNGGGAE